MASEKNAGKKTASKKKQNDLRQTPSIEENLDRLDEILKKMEDADLGLMDTFKLYEEGLNIVKSVDLAIDKVEKRVRMLDADPDGKTDEVSDGGKSLE